MVFIINGLSFSFFFIFLQKFFFKKKIKGFLLKKNGFFLFIYYIWIQFFIYFFFNNLIFIMGMLIDIFGLDKIAKCEINYCLISLYNNLRFFIKLFCSFFNAVFSVSFLFASANWLEREVFDFFGIKFFLHGNLRRILLDYGFLGYPLRKAFPLVGFLEYSFNDLFKNIKWEPVNLTQSFRFFVFLSPWTDNNYDSLFFFEDDDFDY